MTGYVDGLNNANEDWLISSPVDLTGVNNATMTMVYIGRYFNKINDDVTIWASTDYVWNSDPSTAQWKQVPSTLIPLTTHLLKTTRCGWEGLTKILETA